MVFHTIWDGNCRSQYENCPGWKFYSKATKMVLRLVGWIHVGPFFWIVLNSWTIYFQIIYNSLSTSAYLYLTPGLSLKPTSTSFLLVLRMRSWLWYVASFCNLISWTTEHSVKEYFRMCHQSNKYLEILEERCKEYCWSSNFTKFKDVEKAQQRFIQSFQPKDFNDRIIHTTT